MESVIAAIDVSSRMRCCDSEGPDDPLLPGLAMELIKDMRMVGMRLLEPAYPARAGCAFLSLTPNLTPIPIATAMTARTRMARNIPIDRFDVKRRGEGESTIFSSTSLAEFLESNTASGKGSLVNDNSGFDT